MESTSNHHHLQDHQPPAVEPSSLSTTTPAASSCYGSPLGGTNLSWTPNITNLNAGNYLDRNVQEANPRSRALTDNNDIRVPPRPLNGSMIQDDLGYHHHWWTSDIAQSWLTTSQSTHHHLDLQFSKTKEEISGTSSLRKFSTEMPNIPSSMEGYGLAATSTTTTTTTTTTTRMRNNEHRDMSALNEKLLLKTLFSGDFYSTNAQNYHNFGGAPSGVTSRGSFSQIYPSVNISNLNQPSSNYSTAISSSLDMSAQSLDLLTSAKSFSSGLSHHSQQDLGGLGRFAADNLSFRIDHMLHPIDCRSSCSNSSNPSHFIDGTAEAKRPCTSMEPKASQPQMASKKSRSESRPSCPPFKVRKEKLGDRIAALQQLVAPFGKTDTASVLMEAIGYIKFLQSQVETLSVPYMKPSQNQTNRVLQGGSAIGDASGEPKQDLRSRGLCLVPLSCMSYIAGDGGSEVWQQPNFGGAT